MELRYLEIFCRVVECGSFSKAAESLYLTQPTVSIHIKALEDELSTKLLDRLGRKAVPTGEGEVLYQYAKNIVKLKNDVRLALDQFNGRMKGTLAVGASNIPGEYILPSLLGRFISMHSDVFPSLKIRDSREIYAAVLEREVDVGVVGSYAKDKNIITERFLEDELVLVAPKDFKRPVITKKELPGLPLIQREEGSGTRNSLERSLEESGVDKEALDIVAEIGSTQALIQAVASGMGLSFISRLAVKDLVGLGLLKEVRVTGLKIKRHFYIITHRMRSYSPVTRAFIEFLAKGS